MNESLPLPATLIAFVQASPCTFAKTYAKTWPHEYIVRGKVEEQLFVELVYHIRTHGYRGRFYSVWITFFDHDGMVYWTMDGPIEDTGIINRCRSDQTYEHRLNAGTLPEQIRHAEPGVGADSR
jgi:hypothetical protein